MKIIKFIMILSLIALAALKHKRKPDTDEYSESIKESKEKIELMRNELNEFIIKTIIKNEEQDGSKDKYEIIRKKSYEIFDLEELLSKKILDQDIKSKIDGLEKQKIETKDDLNREIESAMNDFSVQYYHDRKKMEYIEKIIRESEFVKGKIKELEPKKDKRRRLR